MQRRKSLAILGAALLVAIVSLIVVSNAEASTFKILYRFTGGADGDEPIAGLIVDAAGNLYGTSNQGGTNHQGVVFELTRESTGKWSEHVLHRFSGGTDGAHPQASYEK
jgi:hypothetical protein